MVLLKKRLVFILICLLSLQFFSLTALPPISNGDSTEIDLSTPYHSIFTFFTYLQKDNYEPNLSAKVFDHRYIGTEEAIDCALKLKRSLNGKGIYIDIDALPKERNYLDTTSDKHRYVLSQEYPVIYLEKVSGQWVFTKEAIEGIDALYSEVFPYGTDKLLKHLPKFGTKKFFGLYVWQHIAILLLIIISVLLHKLLSFLIERFIYRLVRRMGYARLAKNYFIPVARPISILIISIILIVLLPVLQLPALASFYINTAIKALLPFFITIVFYKMVNVFCLYLEKLAGKTETTLDDQLVPLIRKILKIFVIAVGGLFILQNLNINITALLAGLSIGGLAFALAAQDTIKNFFGSVMIFIDKPFQIGHWISTSDINGTVEEVGFRSTRIRTFSNSLVYVPNGKLADTTIDNHGLRQYRRFNTTISITYDTPPELIEVFVSGLHKIVEDHPFTRKDFFIIRLNDFGASSLNIMFYIFFEVATWPEELKCREEIILKIIKLSDTLNVRFAFPTQTLHMESFPEKASLTPQYTASVEDEKKKVEALFKKKN